MIRKSVTCTQEMRTISGTYRLEINRKKLVPWGTDGRLPLSDLDLGYGHTAYDTAYRRASLIDLYLRTKFH